MTTKEIEEYINELKAQAAANGEKKLTLVAQDIADELGLKNRFPMICSAMYNCMKSNDLIIYAPPKGKSNKVEIKYCL